MSVSLFPICMTGVLDALTEWKAKTPCRESFPFMRTKLYAWKHTRRFTFFGSLFMIREMARTVVPYLIAYALPYASFKGNQYVRFPMGYLWGSTGETVQLPLCFGAHVATHLKKTSSGWDSQDSCKNALKKWQTINDSFWLVEVPKRFA